MSTFGWTPSEHRDDLEQFAQRQEHEDAMKDTEPTSTIESLTKDIATIDVAVDALISKNDTLRNSLDAALHHERVLNARIEELEAVKGYAEPVAETPSFVLLARLTKADDENALLRRSLSVLNNRIEELEATRNNVSSDAEALLERLEHIAAVLKTFYFAELSMSSVQPILSLAIEFNPDIVEQRR